MRRRPAPLVPLVALAAAALTAATGATAVGVAAPTAPAAGRPGALSHFDLARKDCVGTARATTSRVWYTVANGVLSDVYEPNIDTTNIETLQFVVTDGRTFTDLQTRDSTYTVGADPTGMACTVTSTANSGRWRLTTTYLTDPGRDSVVLRTRLTPLGAGSRDLKLYVRVDPTIGGHGGGGADNAGADSATIDSSGALVASDTTTETAAVNRDYAKPTYLAVRADRPFPAATSGYAGTPSDGLTQLDAARTLTSTTPDAPDGNVVQAARLDTGRAGQARLVLGFGRTQAEAVGTAGATLGTPFGALAARYGAGWAAYDRGLRTPPVSFPGLSPERARRLARAYYLGVNVVKASEDKEFPGAVVAGLGSPWGQAVPAGNRQDGKAPYFGSYREVFSRDLYEAFTGLLVAGDVATAQATARFLLERQQLADGRLPRNSLVNGKVAPDTGGDQLDETAYPVLMAYQSGLAGDTALYRDHIRRAADFLVARGPSFGSERWEEQSGFSPSTIAAEIAGLVAAGRIAQGQGDADRSRLYLATADHFQRSIKGWTVTSTGPHSPQPYFLRLSKTGDPNAASTYNLGNGGPTVDQRAVVDAGFQELTRLGALPANDADVARSLRVVDQVIRRDTANGPGFHRYGTSTPGTEDGYGDCYQPDPTDCAPTGKPWPGGDPANVNKGSGHLWPVLSGERAEQQLQLGDASGAASLLDTMDRYSSGVGLVPEQSWENPPLSPSPFGSDPGTASIGFADGGPAGSSAPLSWAQAQAVRLTLSVGADRPLEQPDIVRARYVDNPPPATAPLSVSAPPSGANVTTATTAVTGTTTPGTRVVVAATNTDTGAPSTVVGATAGGTGSFSVDVPTTFGTTVITTTATTAAGATGHDQRVVVSDIITGRTLLDVTDPAGDDNGPGTFASPTSPQLQPGAFDLLRFQVIAGGDTVYLRARLRDLTPTFGNNLGAQLLTVFVHDPAAAQTSTQPFFASRNYTVAAQDAWSRAIQVRGFEDPRYITTAGSSDPRCSLDLALAPKAMDVLTPAGVDQSVELDRTRTTAPVVLRGVPVR